MGQHAMVAIELHLSAGACARICAERGNASVGAGAAPPGGARPFAKGGGPDEAALAGTVVEGVVNPHMHTIGGEAPMLIYLANARRVVAINGNMTAPARATIDHYRSLGRELIPPEGLLAAGVPAALDA